MASMAPSIDENGDDQHRQVGIRDAHRAQRVDAADAGQHHVEDHQVDFLGIEQVERLFAARGENDVESLAPQHDFENVAKDFLVIDDQDSQRFLFAHSAQFVTPSVR